MEKTKNVQNKQTNRETKEQILTVALKLCLSNAMISCPHCVAFPYCFKANKKPSIKHCSTTYMEFAERMIKEARAGDGLSISLISMMEESALLGENADGQN